MLYHCTLEHPWRLDAEIPVQHHDFEVLEVAGSVAFCRCRVCGALFCDPPPSLTPPTSTNAIRFVRHEREWPQEESAWGWLQDTQEDGSLNIPEDLRLPNDY